MKGCNIALSQQHKHLINDDDDDNNAAATTTTSSNNNNGTAVSSDIKIPAFGGKNIKHRRELLYKTLFPNFILLYSLTAITTVRNAVSITRDRNQSQAAHSANGIS
jgi:hypothetical protein